MFSTTLHFIEETRFNDFSFGEKGRLHVQFHLNESENILNLKH